MYAWIWRALPGPRWVRAVLVLLLLGAVVAVLFAWVFPQIAPHLPFNSGTIES